MTSSNSSFFASLSISFSPHPLSLSQSEPFSLPLTSDLSLFFFFPSLSPTSVKANDQFSSLFPVSAHCSPDDHLLSSLPSPLTPLIVPSFTFQCVFLASVLASFVSLFLHPLLETTSKREREKERIMGMEGGKERRKRKACFSLEERSRTVAINESTFSFSSSSNRTFSLHLILSTLGLKSRGSKESFLLFSPSFPLDSLEIHWNEVSGEGKERESVRERESRKGLREREREEMVPSSLVLLLSFRVKGQETDE